MPQDSIFRVPEARELTSKERQLLEQLLAHGRPESRTYIAQIPRVTVASRCGCGCPTVDLAVGGRTASPGSRSLIVAEAEGVSPEGVSFGIILHAREGLLSELEVFAKDQAGAFTLPEIQALVWK